MLKNFSILVFLILASSCAELADIDRSNLNHKVMDLTSRETGRLSANCTILNGANSSSQAGCATCAK